MMLILSYFGRFLKHNRIKKLPDGLFESTTLLRWLFLNYNLLEDFNLNILANLTKLQLLILDYNKLTLREMYFPKLPALNEL
jgi:Leucine-rich repeat (LRR) protein